MYVDITVFAESVPIKITVAHERGNIAIPGAVPASTVHFLRLACCLLEVVTHCRVRVMFSVPACKVSGSSDRRQQRSQCMHAVPGVALQGTLSLLAGREAYHTAGKETKGLGPTHTFRIFRCLRRTPQAPANAHLSHQARVTSRLDSECRRAAQPGSTLLSCNAQRGGGICAPVPRLQQSRLQLQAPRGPHLQQPTLAALQAASS